MNFHRVLVFCFWVASIIFLSLIQLSNLGNLHDNCILLSAHFYCWDENDGLPTFWSCRLLWRSRSNRKAAAGAGPTICSSHATQQGRCWGWANNLLLPRHHNQRKMLLWPQTFFKKGATTDILVAYRNTKTQMGQTCRSLHAPPLSSSFVLVLVSATKSSARGRSFPSSSGN